MTRRVLLPVDRSDHAERACELALELFPDATFVLLHVIDPSNAGYSSEVTVASVGDEWYDQQQDRAESLFEQLEEQMAAGDSGTTPTTEHTVQLGQPPGTIVRFVEDGDIDHVVMGSQGRRGVSRLLLGSVAETVVRRSPVPVTVAR